MISRNFEFFICFCKLAVTFYVINEIQPKENFKILSNAPQVNNTKIEKLWNFLEIAGAISRTRELILGLFVHI